METEFLAEWADGPQCVEPSLFGGWKLIVSQVAEMGVDAGCNIDVTRDDENAFGQTLYCIGQDDSGFVTDGTTLTATTTASLDGDTLNIATRYQMDHAEIPGVVACTLAGTGRRVEACEN